MVISPLRLAYLSFFCFFYILIARRWFNYISTLAIDEIPNIGFCLPKWKVRLQVWRPPGIPPGSHSVGSSKGELAVPQKVIQESTRTEAFTVLNCGAGRRSVNAGRWPLSGLLAAPLMGRVPPAPVLVTATHKGAQEDANQDEWPLFFLKSFCTNQSFSFVSPPQPPPPLLPPPLGYRPNV